ncbi:hypothetical protein BKA70DRAFT_1245344 [Coprinopsis sp. MPI-PUGE-AT-0042]|nr:hypothetical protein BKA70DRAFT_1245344 [Coprinopsis sp. MPI-PUGE-AT-0042]
MVDWMSPETILSNADSFSKFMHALLGVYLWEFATSLEFDWRVITGRVKMRYTLIPYFLNRYMLLFALIGIAIALNVKQEVDCQALYTFNSIFGNAAIGLASVNLSMRAYAVWGKSKKVAWPLGLIALGQWALLLHGVLLKAQWVPGQGCVITETSNTILAASFIYTMSFDFIVLVLVTVKLFIPNEDGRSSLVSRLLRDGFTFFTVAFIANLLATIFMLLNLNPVMSIIANVPAAIASSIVATRAARNLIGFYGGPHSSSPASGGFPNRSNGGTGAFSEPVFAGAKSGVYELNTVGTQFGRDQKTTYEATAVNIQRSQHYDPESQSDLEIKAPSLHH